METKGKIVESFPIKTGVNARGDWQVQEFLLEVIDEAHPEAFPRKVFFSVHGENIERFNLQVGMHVIITISINAREWKGRWYNTVSATDARPFTPQPQPQPQPQEQPQGQPSAGNTIYAKDVAEDGELPF